jgi:hypothetical protein
MAALPQGMPAQESLVHGPRFFVGARLGTSDVMRGRLAE